MSYITIIYIYIYIYIAIIHFNLSVLQYDISWECVHAQVCVCVRVRVCVCDSVTSRSILEFFIRVLTRVKAGHFTRFWHFYTVEI